MGIHQVLCWMYVSKVHWMMVRGNKMHCKTHRTVIVSSIKYSSGP